MSFLDRARNKLEEVVGGVKETFGEATGNQAMEVSGEAEADAARQREWDEEHPGSAERHGTKETDDSGNPVSRGPGAEGAEGTADSDGPDDTDDGRGGVLAR